MDFNINLENFTHEELEEEYLQLQTKYKQLCIASEEDAQRIYELKRCLETSVAGEKYLSQELEQLTLNSQQKCEHTKLQDEYKDLRRQHHELNTEFATLQEQNMVIAEENTKLRTDIENFNAEKDCNSTTQSESCNERMIERFSNLEQENMELLKKLDEQQADKMQQTMALAEKDKKIVLMEDEVSCLQENMRCKREELDEKTRMLESAQEQLFEANSKINMLTSSPDNEARKGNSLFAEVDDQRQAMRQLLAAQKKSYQEMKKTYIESQSEIRRLKRENSAMHKELQACSAIFCNADRIYQDKLNNRIQYLLNEKEDLEAKLKWMHQHLRDLASEKGVLWLDSMLSFCKKETEDLKQQLHSMLIKSATLEEQLRNVQQDMVRWRFEALKSRCLLIDRENLLTDHNIAFKPQNYVQYTISEEQAKSAKPRIVPGEAKICTATNNGSMNCAAVSESNSNQERTTAQSKETFTICLDDTIDGNDKNSISKSEVVEKCFSNKIEEPVLIINDNKVEKSCTVLQEISPQIQTATAEHSDTKPLLNFKDKPCKLPSILSKSREIINLNLEKNVKFSKNEPTVYNIPESPVATVEVKEENPNCVKDIKRGNCTETTVKTVRTKSNVIVRHFVVGSKSK